MGRVSLTKKKNTSTKQTQKSKKEKNQTIDLNQESDENDFHSDDDSNSVDQENTPPKSSFLHECKQLFATTDLYAVLNLEKTKATPNDIKRSYYKLSLKYHPDKVSDESKKEEAKLKFQILGKIYSILSDEEKKKVYDETGSIGDDDFYDSDIKDWEGYWRALFKKVTTEDVDKFFEKYKNSDEERSDLLRFYEKHQGDMDLILEEMFTSDVLEDEPRMKDIIKQAIEKGDVPDFDKFSNENKRKASKRKAYFEKEAKEAEELRKEMGIDESQDSLRKAILSRRKQETESFLDRLTEKYSNPVKPKKGKQTKTTKKEESEEDEEEEEENSEDESDDDKEYNKKNSKSKSSVNKKKVKVEKFNSKGRLVHKKVKRL